MNVTELAACWPHGLTYNGSQYEGPCPYCNTDSKDGAVILEGQNRFHLFADGNGGHCRHCELAGRGSTGRGWYSAAQIIQRFGFNLTPEMLAERKAYFEAPPEEKPLRMMWSQWQVDQAHKNVDYLFWDERYGFDKETVDHFQLGYGIFHDSDPPQHIIPMNNLERYGKPAIKGLYYIATRGFDKDGNKIKKHSSGTSKPYLWMIEEDPADKTLVITEGDTDPIAAWSIYYKNIASVLGATTWMEEKAQLLVDKGYEKFIILGDDGEAGQALVWKIEESLFRLGKTDVWRLSWD